MFDDGRFWTFWIFPENCISSALLEILEHHRICLSSSIMQVWDDFGLTITIKKRMVKKMISSYVGENAEFERHLLSGRIRSGFDSTGTLGRKASARWWRRNSRLLYSCWCGEQKVAEGKENQKNLMEKLIVWKLARKLIFSLVKACGKGIPLEILIF